MTKAEFEQRVGIQVSNEEFDAVNTIYMSSDDAVTKDDIANWWKRTHKEQIRRFNEVKKAREEKIKRYELACECRRSISIDDMYIAKRLKSSTCRLLERLGIAYENRTPQSVWVELRSMQYDLHEELGL